MELIKKKTSAFQNNTIKIMKSKQHTKKIYVKHVSDNKIIPKNLGKI